MDSMPTLLLFFDGHIWIFRRQKLWLLHQEGHRKFLVKPTPEQGKEFIASVCRKMGDHSVVWSKGDLLLRPHGLFECEYVREEQGIEIWECALHSEDPALWFSKLLEFNQAQVVLPPLGGRPVALHESYFE